jgi:putative ABC transport system substrate-binding protein
MRRREFLALLGGTAIAGPLAAHAQQPTLPVVGILSSASRSAFTDLLGPFRQGLKEAGYIEGENVAIESRWAEGHFERLPNLAAELVQRRPAVIVTTGGSSTLAVRAASSTVPHVFLSHDDPVKLGWVVSFNHPGGNATGMSLLTSALVAKRLELVRQLAPADAPISYLMNPQAPEAQSHLGYMQAAAREIGQQINLLSASSERDIDNAFTTLAQRGGVLIVSTDPFFISQFIKSLCSRPNTRLLRFMIVANLS